MPENTNRMPWDADVVADKVAEADEVATAEDAHGAYLNGTPADEYPTVAEELEHRLLLSSAAVDRRFLDGMLDLLRDDARRRHTVGNMRDTIVDVVRTRAAARTRARVERLDGETPTSSTDVRRELVGAADDADVLDALGSAFTAGAVEARGVAGDLLDELPGRGGKPRASIKAADGSGFEVTLKRETRRDLSVDVDEVVAVLVAASIAAEGAKRHASAYAGMDDYAAGLRDGIAALRSVLSTTPAFRSTALDSLVTTLENDEDDTLAKRLRKAYGRVDKGDPRVVVTRTPITTGADS